MKLDKYQPAKYIESIKETMTSRAKELLKKSSFQESVMKKSSLSEQYDNVDQETPWFNRDYVKQLLNTFSIVTCPSCNYDEVVGTSSSNFGMTSGVNGIDSDTGSSTFSEPYGYNQNTVSYANGETGGNDGEYE